MICWMKFRDGFSAAAESVESSSAAMCCKPGGQSLSSYKRGNLPHFLTPQYSDWFGWLSPTKLCASDIVRIRACGILERMDSTFQAALTPEQLAAVHAGGGFARVVDPATNRIFVLIEQTEPSTLDDDYVREKIDEAYAAGQLEPLDMAAVKAEFWRRQVGKMSPRQ
jgi:hypothetical protein